MSQSLGQTFFVGTKGAGVRGVDFPGRDLVLVFLPGTDVMMAGASCSTGIEVSLDDGG